MLSKIIIDFLVSNLETIKNILLSLASIMALIGLVFFHIKIFFTTRTIKEINKKIEEEQKKVNEYEIDNITGLHGINKVIVDLFGSEQKDNRKIEQYIQKLTREKNNLLEEISILKIFKK